MSTVRSRQLSYKMGNAALGCVRVTNKFQTAVHRSNSRDHHLQFNGLVLIVQNDGPFAARYDVMWKVEPHPLDADVCAAACQQLIEYAELSGKINGEPRVSILESMHKLFILAERWLDDSP